MQFEKSAAMTVNMRWGRRRFSGLQTAHLATRISFGRILAGLLLSHGTIALAQANLQPFVLPWNDVSPWPGQPKAPAPVSEPVHIGSDGHLYVGGNRIRFVGVNLAMGGALLTHDQADAVAGRLAKFGINAVRLHNMDFAHAPKGIFAASSSTRSLDAEALDRVHYLVARLAEHGIYCDVNLLCTRKFDAADGIPDSVAAFDPRAQRGASGFYPPLIELQHDYARQLLSSPNPYRDGLPLSHDPAVAMVEINNENGIFKAWFWGQLNDPPAPIQTVIQQRWNEWLVKKYANTANLKRAWGNADGTLGQNMAASASNWSIQSEDGKNSDFSAQNAAGSPSLAVNIKAAAAIGSDERLTYPSLHLKADQLYTITFDATVDKDTSLVATVRSAPNTGRPMAMNQTNFKILAGSEQSFRFSFVAPTDFDDAVLSIGDLGVDAPRMIKFKNVTLRPGGQAGPRDGETLENGSLPPILRNNSRAWSNQAMADWMHFLEDADTQYWVGMSDFLKSELGFKGVVVGTSVGYSSLLDQAQLDATDSHMYWHHPEFFGRTQWGSAAWSVRNESMVNAPFAPGSVVGMATEKVAGKPHFVTEYNNPAPNTFSGEGPLLLAAFAAFQDWDGFFWFDYGTPEISTPQGSGFFHSFFDVGQHPTKLANLFLASQMFARGDISPARTTVHYTFDPQQDPARIALTRRAWKAPNADDAMVTALEHGIDYTFTPAAGPTPSTTKSPTLITSDTGEMTWDTRDPHRGVVEINSPKTRAIIGFTAGRSFRLGDVTITPGQTAQGWSTIGLTITEGENLASHCKAVIVATGLAENTDMRWKNDQHDNVTQWGKAPSLVEVIPADIELPAAAARVHAIALDATGHRAAALPVQTRGDHAVVHIGPPAATLWYEIEID